MANPQALSARQLAERWSCSPANIYNLIRRGDLPRIPISSPIRISLQVIEAMERHGLSEVERASSDGPANACEEPSVPKARDEKTVRKVQLPNGRWARPLVLKPR